MQNIEIRDLRHKQFFVVDDEYLNGYARLCGINATGVYLSLCRHASKNQTCFPSKKLIADELSISERSVYTAVKKLEEWGVILIEDQGRKGDGSFKSKIYTLVDKKQWKTKPQANGADGNKQHSPQANDDTHRRHVVPNKETHRRRKHIEEGIATTSVAEPINQVFKIFYDSINPQINYGNRTWRKATEDLIKSYGLEEVLKLTAVACAVQGREYAPTITNPYQLKEKLASLKIWIERANQPKKGAIQSL